MNLDKTKVPLLIDLTFTANGNVERGCVASLTRQEKIASQADKSFKICQGSMCNVKETFQRCYHCNSSDDSNCATVRGKLPQVTCDEYLDTCRVYVKPNMTTHRGCSSGDTTTCSPGTVNCKQSKENLSNGDVFPSNRLSCHHCDEGVDSTSDCYGSLVGMTNFSYPCEVYNFRDSCYLYVDESKLAYRGCLSDRNNITEACLADSSHCYTCQSSNCNAISVKKEPKLKCMDCDTTNGLECLWGLSDSYSMACKKSLFFYETESCFILSSTELGFAIRGCTHDTNVCSRAKCDECSDDNCNRLGILEQVCYDCSSDDEENCWMEPFHTENVTCSKDVQYDRRGCYTWAFENATIRRGCFSDLSLTERISCLQHTDHCKHCVDQGNCNKIQISNVAISVGPTFKFNLTFVFLLMILIAISCHLIIY